MNAHSESTTYLPAKVQSPNVEIDGQTLPCHCHIGQHAVQYSNDMAWEGNCTTISGHSARPRQVFVGRMSEPTL